MRELTIGRRIITDDSPCYVIAELGHNHGGSLATAQQMIQAASVAGASAVKLQKRDNQTLYSPKMLAKPYDNEHSFGPTYGAHRAALEFGIHEYRACQATAHERGVDFFATAFDERSADFLMHVGVPAIKIASGGLTDTPLLAHVATLGVPIILSTGGSDERDIDAAIQVITGHTRQLAVLHCTAAYPVRDYGHLNLSCIRTLQRRYPELVVGYSGHDTGIAMSVVAYVLGARIIEKHFTLDRTSKGTDHAFSLEPLGLKKLVRDLDRTRLAMGDGLKKIYDEEIAPILKMRRNLYVNGQWQIGTVEELEAAPRI